MNKEIDISIVIPAFNEAKRLPVFLERVISYCTGSEKRYEIIVVNDGSNDKTAEAVASYKIRFPNLDIINIKENNGKGNAVKRGFLESNGKICLFMDADGSVDPNEIEKNLHYILEEKYDIFIGSRVLKNKEQILKTRLYRKIIGTVFNFFVQTFLFKNIKDTQCGFKMFRKETIAPIFSRSHLKGFGFDIEILYLAYKMGYKIKEGPVSWHHVPHSSINLFIDSIKMFFNIIQIRNWHYTPINPKIKYMGPDEYKYMYEMENYHWWFVSRRHLIKSLIKSLDISSPTILDVGMGTGGNLSAFNKPGKAYGMDISGQAMDFCRKRGLKNIIQCTAENLGYSNKAFDIITCIDVLEHVHNPLEALLELRRVLKDEGKIIITVPAFKILWSQHDEALSHLRRYEKKSLSYDLHEAGLGTQRIGYFFFTSFFIVAPVRIIRKFFSPMKNMHSDTTTLPPRFLNEFLKFLFKIETRVSDKLKLPFGTTLYAVVYKK